MGEAKLRLRTFSPPRPSKKAAWLGCVAGLLSRLHIRRISKTTPADLRKHDYHTSTQRMGLSFTERIRNTFRFRWLRRTR
jgi:hypothetical protein